MLRRIFAIELREDAPPRDVEKLVTVLEDAPKFIRGLMSARVRTNISTQPYDLVWEHEFVDRESYLNYVSHPYHINFIDEWLAPESPRRLNPTRAMTLLYDEDDEQPVTEHVPADLKWVTTAGVGVQQYDGPIVLLDQVWLKKGATTEYMELFQSEYLPTLLRRGMRLIGCWKSATDSGPEEEIVFLWSIGGHGWREWARIRHDGVTDPTVLEWQSNVKRLVEDGRRRLFEPMWLGTSSPEAETAGQLTHPGSLGGLGFSGQHGSEAGGFSAGDRTS